MLELPRTFRPIVWAALPGLVLVLLLSACTGIHGPGANTAPFPFSSPPMTRTRTRSVGVTRSSNARSPR